MNGKRIPTSPALGQHNPSQAAHSSQAGPVVELGRSLSVSDGFADEPGQNGYERRRMATGGHDEGQENDQ